MRRAILALIAGTITLSAASANSPRRPISYKKTSPDGRHVFVMIGSYSAQEEPTHWIEPRSSEIKAIRDKYTASGMYRNDGSTTPLWTVDWYAYEVDVPNGGECVVRYRAAGFEPKPGPTLGFYRNGELIRGYRLLELMSVFLLSDEGDWASEHRLSDDSRTVEVATKSGDRYVFEVQTGEMVFRFRPVRYAIVGTVVAIILTIWWLRRRRRLRAGRPGTIPPPSRSASRY